MSNGACSIALLGLCGAIVHSPLCTISFPGCWQPIWSSFDKDFAWWGVALSGQTMLFVATRIFWAENILFAGAIAVYWCVFFLFLQMLLRPFSSEPGNESANVAAVCILMTTVGAVASTVASHDNEGQTTTANKRLLAWLTVLSLVIGGIIIAKNAGKVLLESARNELTKKLTKSVLKAPLFQDCDPAFINDCSLGMKSLAVQSGDTICSLGDIGDRCWVLKVGAVDLIDENGVVTRSFVGNEEVTPIFGELALLENAPRGCTIIAKSACQLAVLTRKVLYDCFARHEGAENIVLAALDQKYADRQVRLQLTIQAATVEALIGSATCQCTTVQEQVLRDQALDELRRRSDHHGHEEGI